MLKLVITLSENWNLETEEFEYDRVELELEHSLAAVSKWESKYEKPFLDDSPRSGEELFDYINMMVLTPDHDPDVFSRLEEPELKRVLDEIQNYLESKQTATWFNEIKTSKKTTEKITAEIIYYWITSYQIPWEVQYWHINKLLTLIKVFNLKNEDPKNQPKRSRSEIAAERARINAERRAKYNTTG